MNKLLFLLLTLTLSVWSASQVLAAELTVTPERAAPSGTILITSKLSTWPTTCNVVVTDAYRGTALLRSRKSLVRNTQGEAEVNLSYSAQPGAYAVWIEDMRGTRLAGPGYFFVPGITKRGAWWLFTGQPMCGAIRTWGGVDGEAEKLIQPPYKGGYGFNVLTLEIHASMIETGEAKNRSHDWPILERNGAYAFALPGELGWEGLTGPFAVDKKQNEQGKPSNEGGFWSGNNRAAVMNYVQQLKASQFPTGTISPAFLGICAFENHMGFGPWFDYSPSAIAAYRAAMHAKFTTIEAYNKAYGTTWQSWDALDAPRDAQSTRHDWIPWTDFRFRNIADFYSYLQPEMRHVFPGAYLLPIIGGMLGTMQNDDWVTGSNAFVASDEREVAKTVDVIGTEGWADYVAGHSDLLTAATDPGLQGVPSKPIWPDYYTYLSIGPDIANSLILKRVDQIGHGATGTFMEHVGAIYEMGKKEPAFLDHLRAAGEVNRFLCEKANLFVGSHVVPDVALVTPTDTLKYGRDKDTVRDADSTNAGIAHALTRLHLNKRWLYQDAFTAEAGSHFPAVLATLGNLTSDRFLSQAERYVRSGGKLYLEGLGERNEFYEPAPGRLNRFIGAQVTAATPTDDEITLVNDAAISGQILRFKIRRLSRVERVSPDTQVVAKFTDGSPAVLLRRVGKGILIWAPNWIVRDASFAYIHAITQQREKPFDFWAAFDPAYCAYYAAILNHLSVQDTQVTGPNNDAVRTSVLKTSDGTTLLSLVNYGNARDVTVRLSGDGHYLSDLRTGTAISFKRTNHAVEFRYHTPANAWTFFALANNERGLNTEIHKPLYQIHENKP
ncbi:MAG: beta-galactosidase [Abitibacteriaceae bacterium]|nr:beta-galactosidase [Abditibacteriaceae bacterium]